MQLRITASAFNDRGPLYTEQVLAALHQGNAKHQAVTLSLLRFGSSVGLACDVPAELQALLRGQLLAHYPTAHVESQNEACRQSGIELATWSAELTLRPEVFPLKRYPQFEDPVTRTSADPLTGLLTALAGSERDPLCPRIDLTIRPARKRQVYRAHWTLRQLRRSRFAAHRELAERFVAWSLSPRFLRRFAAWCLVRWAGSLPVEHSRETASRTHDRESAFAAANDKLRRHLFAAHLQLSVTAPASHEQRALEKLHELAGALGQLTIPDQAIWHLSSLTRHEQLPAPTSPGFLLSAEELATLWHLPTFTIQAPTLDLAPYRQLEPPPEVPDPSRDADVAALGRIQFRNHHRIFGIRQDDRRRHLYIVGKTGMGKSTLLLNLLAADIRAGHGCCLVDPHGDLADTLLSQVPSRRTNDVVLFDAGDQTHPVAFNPLCDCEPQARPLVASGMLSAFKKLYGDSWGPRLEHIFRNCLLALLEVPGASLLSLVQLLSDARYRQSIVGRVTDPVVRSFWRQEFAGMPEKLRAEAIAPIQNKVGHFVSSPLLRHILGQPRSTLDLRQIMDRGQVLIVNLSKGRMGEDASSLLGSLVITALQLAAMSRADQPEAERRDFYLYVDEFQHFATESFATILSEARKYRLCLTLANQYLAQMDDATAAAVFGNAGSLLSFQVGAGDSELLATQLGGQATPEDLLAIPKHEAYVRLLVDGLPGRPFSMRTLPPESSSADPHRADIIRRASRRRYARPLHQVERDVAEAFSGRV